jgi:hypothetical protein
VKKTVSKFAFRVHSLQRYDAEEQQAAIAAVCNHDAYNWGYDPVHYGGALHVGIKLTHDP